MIARAAFPFVRKHALEIILLGFVAATGIGGGFLCRQHLASIQAAHVAEVEVTNMRIEEYRRKNESLRQQLEMNRALREMPPAATAAASASSAVPLRVDAILQLAEILVRDPIAVMSFRMMQMQGAARADVARMRAQKSGAVSTPQPTGPAFFLRPDGRLPERFGELFALSASECARLEQAIVSVVQQVEARILSNTQVRELSEGRVVLHVEPVPDATSYFEQFVAAFQTVAGAERYRAFALLNGVSDRDGGFRNGGPADFLRSFGGEGARSVTLTRIENGYRYESRHVDGSARRSGTVRDIGSLRERVGPIVQLLPPGF